LRSNDWSAVSQSHAIVRSLAHRGSDYSGRAVGNAEVIAKPSFMEDESSSCRSFSASFRRSERRVQLLFLRTVENPTLRCSIVRSSDANSSRRRSDVRQAARAFGKASASLPGDGVRSLDVSDEIGSGATVQPESRAGNLAPSQNAFT